MPNFVNTASAASTSVTLPAFNEGDLLLVFAMANTAVAPTLPAGFTNVFSQAANGLGFRVGFKLLHASDTSGVWTNANLVIASIYRGVTTVGGANSATNTASTTTTISGVATFANIAPTSWVVSFGGSLQTVSQSTPATTTLRGSPITGSGCMALVCDSNAGVASYGQKTSTAGASAAGGGGSVELFPSSSILNNYLSIKAGDGISVGERIR